MKGKPPFLEKLEPLAIPKAPAQEKAGETKEGVHPSSPHRPSETYYIRLMPLGCGVPGAGVKAKRAP